MRLVLAGRGVMEQIEVVKGLGFGSLLDRIQSSLVSNLELTCGELVCHIITNNVACSQVVQQLTDPKTPSANKSEKALHLKNKRDVAFGTSSFQQALELYTQES